jgi:starch phosphorylase
LGLYVPAASGARGLTADGYAGAKALAQWRSGVEEAWGRVAVQHVEATGVGDAPIVGATLHLRAVISLGGLRPEDVLVQAAWGRIGSDDDMVGPDVVIMHAGHGDADHGDGSYSYDADIALSRPGPFGYTVRVLPVHPLLASPTELGLVATAT